MKLRIKGLRENRDLTWEIVASVLGCSQETYFRYENEEVRIPYQELCFLADYFGTSVDYLLGRTDEQEPYPPSRRK